jgi:hypothetical protein
MWSITRETHDIDEALKKKKKTKRKANEELEECARLWTEGAYIYIYEDKPRATAPTKILFVASMKKEEIRVKKKKTEHTHIYWGLRNDRLTGRSEESKKGGAFSCKKSLRTFNNDKVKRESNEYGSSADAREEGEERNHEPHFFFSLNLTAVP